MKALKLKTIFQDLKLERKKIREIIKKLEAKEIAFNNQPWSDRHDIVCDLLEIAKRAPTNATLIKATLEIYSYNDGLAAHMLRDVAETDYKELIKKAKHGK